MKIVIVGATGYIGSKLFRTFVVKGHQVHRVSHLQLSTATLSGADVVINLSGATVGRMWTKSYRKIIRGSRISTTNHLVSIINILPRKPQLLISASAVGVYNIGGKYDENEQNLGTDFLATVCLDWENEARQVSNDVRLVIMRMGTVISRDGGVLQRMIKTAKRAKVSFQVGDDKALMPWIAMEDLIRAVLFVKANENISGVVNMVAPSPISHSDLARKVANICGLRYVLRIPYFIMRLFFGAGSTVLRDSREVVPKKLMDAGFEYSCKELENL